MATVIETADVQVQTSLALLQELVRGYAPRDFAVRFWDGTTWDAEPHQEAHFTLVLNHPGALRSMFWPPTTRSWGQAFLYDDFNVEGDMLAFAVFCDYLANLKPTLSLFQRLNLGWRLWNLPRDKRPRTGLQTAQLRGQLHSRQRDREAISYHYDLSNQFFELILDSRMQYTCANFADAHDDLETAQQSKLDLICRKLRLKPGQRLLDIGCGWGGLVMFAAKNYGVEAVGVTLSARQVEWAQKQIRAAGLENRCRVDLMDYRDVDEGTSFDKIATVEMTEHLGSSQFPTYFQKCWRLLRPHGSLLIQQITQADPLGLPCARSSATCMSFLTASWFRSLSRNGRLKKRASRSAMWKPAASTMP